MVLALRRLAIDMLNAAIEVIEEAIEKYRSDMGNFLDRLASASIIVPVAPTIVEVPTDANKSAFSVRLLLS